MGRALSLLAAVLAMAAMPQAASAHPVGMRVAHPRPQPATAHARAARHAAAFTLVDAANGAVVRARPNGAFAGTLPGRTPLGTATWLWAVQTSADGRWARVILPWRPNGRTGWISLRGRHTVVVVFQVRESPAVDHLDCRCDATQQPRRRRESGGPQSRVEAGCINGLDGAKQFVGYHNELAPAAAMQPSFHRR